MDRHEPPNKVPSDCGHSPHGYVVTCPECDLAEIERLRNILAACKESCGEWCEENERLSLEIEDLRRANLVLWRAYARACDDNMSEEARRAVKHPIRAHDILPNTTRVPWPHKTLWEIWGDDD